MIFPDHSPYYNSNKQPISETVEAYSKLFARFVNKKLVYQAAATYYDRLDLGLFTFPLLILQIANAILPSLNLTDPATNQIISTITTAISAVSAAWIATQGKLSWGKRAEKYNNVASAYALLASNSYFKMTQIHILEKDAGPEQEKIFKQDLLNYIEESSKHEKSARAGVPLPPSFIEERILEKYALKEKEKSMENKIRNVIDHGHMMNGVDLNP